MLTLINATCCAANVAAYAVWGWWGNIFVAVFCGLMAIYTAIGEAR